MVDSSMKIALIIDKSESYVSYQIERTLESWKIDRAETRKATSITDVGGASLFGGAPCSILKLENAEEVKKVVLDIEKVTAESLKLKFESGLIVATTVARTSTKKLETHFKSLGAKVIIPPGKSEDPLAIKLLSDLALRKEIRELLVSYVGDDYDSLIPIVESISKLPRKTHSLINEEDIFARFPQPPGAIPPWLIEDPLFNGDLTEVISVSRRVAHHSHFLVTLATLKNKFQLLYRVSEVVSVNPKVSTDELCKIFEIKSPKYAGFLKSRALKYGVQTFRSAVLIIEEAETSVKGGSAAPPLVMIEKMLVELVILLRK
jgi:hypothetical protein